MRLFANIVAFLSFSSILLANAQGQPPSVKTVQNISNLLVSVLQDVKTFDGSAHQTEKLVRHFEETLESLDFAVKEMRESASIGFMAGVQLIATGGTIGDTAKAITASLKTKTTIIRQVQLDDKFFYMLDHAYSATSSLIEAISKKIPSGILPGLLQFFNNDVSMSIGQARELFRPVGAVVVVVEQPRPKTI